jgi:hypothetical protein
MMPPEDHCYAGMSSAVPRRLLAERRNSLLSREQLVLGEIVVRSYLFILVYANFDQSLEFDEDGTKPST